MILHRAWLYEQAELDYITTKKKVGQLKNLITTRSDDLRVPFGKGTEKQDRAGTWWAPLMAPFFVVIPHSAAGSSSSNARNHLMPGNA